MQVVGGCCYDVFGESRAGDDVYVYQLPVLLPAGTEQPVPFAGVDVHVLHREMPVVHERHSAHAVIIVLHAVEFADIVLCDVRAVP